LTEKLFEPKRVLFEEAAVDYPLGRKLWERFCSEGREVKKIASHNRVTGLPGKSPSEKFREAKRTLVVGVRRSREFASCRPSADFQLVLSTSCPGMCEYCYLHTTLGCQPVVRLYVNIEEILSQAEKVIDSRRPAVTTFEGAATSDPLPLERFSSALAEAVLFFPGRRLIWQRCTKWLHYCILRQLPLSNLLPTASPSGEKAILTPFSLPPRCRLTRKSAVLSSVSSVMANISTHRNRWLK